ncbi:MAG: glycosyltransferase family 2 protein [Jatrophihabitans sp.]|uniref:glycosyltransferase n=1 Tax=Jatrophihabitans sp. TaxID=1932789 RepID=UPI003914F9EE
MSGRLVRLGSGLAVVGLAHAVSNARLLRRPPARPPDPQMTVAVLVPARNEVDRIGDCVRSVDGQGAVLVLDDESTDGTATAARAAGARVLDGTPPPSGWLGKPWACAQLAAATDADVLVFVDADVRLAPRAVAAAVAVLDEAGLDVVCPFPRQLAGTVAERLIQPLLQWSWLTTLPLRPAERSPRPSLTAACGQFLVVRRTALEQAGGHTAIRDQVLDDLALVRAVKAAGGRGGVIDGTDLATCRMYDGWPALRDGYRKSLWAAFGSPAGAGAALTLLGVAYMVPAVAALRGSRTGTVGYLAGVASRVVTARRTGGRALPDACAHPVSVLVLGHLTVRSLLGRRAGTLRWKGRPV